MPSPNKYSCAVLEALPTVAHGFFGRQGGVSSGIYDSLNCALGSDDAPENIAQNRERVLQALCNGAKAELRTLYQCHSAEIVTLTDAATPTHTTQADALVTTLPHLALGILTADCAPILLADTNNSVIAAAHAGWKGAFSGVIENTIAAMQRLGAAPETLIACIGPCIHQASYEVGEEFRTRFLEQHPENAQYFIPGEGGKWYYDLPSYIAVRLVAAGLTQVHQIAHDTQANEADFFSYRRSTLRDEPDYGRQLSVIMLENSS